MTNETAPHLSQHLSWYLLSTDCSTCSVAPLALPNHFSHPCLRAFSTTFFFHLYCRKRLPKAESYSTATHPNSYSFLSHTFCPCVPAQKKKKKCIFALSHHLLAHTQRWHTSIFTCSNYPMTEAASTLAHPKPQLVQGRKKVPTARHVKHCLLKSQHVHRSQG